MCAWRSSLGVVNAFVSCLKGCLVVIWGDGQQYYQVGISTLGVLTVGKTVKEITREEWKQCSAGLSGKTDKLKQMIHVPVTSWSFLCSWKEPHVATSGWAYLKVEEGQGLEGRRTETKGDLSEQTKQKLAGYWQAKQRESSIHGFCCCFVPHQLLKMTPHRERREFYFTLNNLWFASVYSG